MLDAYDYKLKPQINVSWPTSMRMWIIAGCAFLCVFQSALTDGGRSFVIAISVFAAALLLELFITKRKYGTSKIKDGSAVATSMILTLLLPNLIHPVYAVFGIIFAIVVVKYSFGGLGSNWLNPALGGWLFIRFSWPAAFTNALADSSSSIFEMNMEGNVSVLDDTLTTFLNDSIFSFAGVQIPQGYVNLLFSVNPGLIADRGIFALLAGTVVITAMGINRGWIPLVFLSVYGILIRFAGNLNGEFWNGDIIYGLLSGGTLLAGFVLAAEPATSAKLRRGILFTVILTAILSWFFRYRCLEFTGCFIAIVLVNCITPLVRLLEDRFFLHGNNSVSMQGE